MLHLISPAFYYIILLRQNNLNLEVIMEKIERQHPKEQEERA